MKKIYTLLSLAITPFITQAQNWQNHSFESNQLNRIYKTYHSNAQQQDMSVVIMLHGLGGSMNDVDLTNFKEVADTANLLLVSPQAVNYVNPNPLLGDLGPAWNSGINIYGTIFGDIYLNSNIDDVSFIKQLVDTIKVNYNVNPDRIFVAGFSNGGFMTQKLLCEAPEYFRAGASHSGTKALAVNNCATTTKPVAHFHGTQDETVDEQGNFYMMGFGFNVGISVDSLVNYWTIRNNAALVDSTNIGNPSNSTYITHYTYAGDEAVEHFKIHNGGHRWYSYDQTNNSYDLAIETWKFFNKWITSTPNSVHNLSSENTVHLFPNPSSSVLHIESTTNQFKSYKIFDINGQLKTALPFNNEIDVKHLTSGVYFIQFIDAQGNYKQTKFVKN